MSLPREHSQENLSIAYISAVAAKAGFMCFRPQDYGTDIEVGIVEQIGNNRIDTGYRLCIQAKASHNYRISDQDNCIVYDLDVKNYRSLIMENRGIPAILVLYCMPANDDDWLSVYENCTTLKHCGYWISLKGNPESNNSSTQSIKIPKEQMFTESTLTSIMEHIKNGEVL
ncbi:MAG: DUF4365 domain-containing protein [Euryarchaeota archaeon]|nr:DUF4365 domain-containing protein [Euryarchaeota archaeon]MBU4340146.1 DUF4365 domain-containing protein [Euryarchaeota archaeon]MCG2736990.1 DUF4365 domain-containing protein [Candidatus Methanoperedenaceae archaeon]